MLCERVREVVEYAALFHPTLAVFPQRGTDRNDLRPGLRVLGFERRVAIAFHVDAETVTILRVLYGGRDLGTAFRPPD